MAKAIPLPPLAYLREALDYDPDTGALTWRERPVEHFSSKSAWAAWNAMYVGKTTGSLRPDGYAHVALIGKRFMAHRIAFYLSTGEQPKIIDHKDGDRANNMLCNLRGCSKAENGRHRVGLANNNTSGVRNVSRNSDGRKWGAQIKINGVTNYLGSFTNKADAAAAAAAARAKYYGEFKGVDV